MRCIDHEDQLKSRTKFPGNRAADKATDDETVEVNDEGLLRREQRRCALVDL